MMVQDPCMFVWSFGALFLEDQNIFWGAYMLKQEDVDLYSALELCLSWASQARGRLEQNRRVLLILKGRDQPQVGLNGHALNSL